MVTDGLAVYFRIENEAGSRAIEWGFFNRHWCRLHVHRRHTAERARQSVVERVRERDAGCVTDPGARAGSARQPGRHRCRGWAGTIARACRHSAVGAGYVTRWYEADNWCRSPLWPSRHARRRPHAARAHAAIVRGRARDSRRLSRTT